MSPADQGRAAFNPALALAVVGFAMGDATARPWADADGFAQAPGYFGQIRLGLC